MLTDKLLLNEAQKQVVLGVFMPLILSKYGNLNLENTIEKLKFEFNFEVNRQDIIYYYEPTLQQTIEDLHLTLKHVGVNYG